MPDISGHTRRFGEVPTQASSITCQQLPPATGLLTSVAVNTTAAHRIQMPQRSLQETGIITQMLGHAFMCLVPAGPMPGICALVTIPMLTALELTLKQWSEPRHAAPATLTVNELISSQLLGLYVDFTLAFLWQQCTCPHT